MSKPITRSSIDTVDSNNATLPITSSSIVPATETTSKRCAQVRNFPKTPEKSYYLSTFLNAYKRSLPLAKLFQNAMNVYNRMLEIIRDLSDKCQLTAVGSLAEGLNTLTSDIDFIAFKCNYEVLENINDDNDRNCPWLQVERLPVKGHPGYSKLRVISPDCFQISGEQNKYTVAKDDRIFLKNNLKEFIVVSEFESPKEIIFHGPAYTFEQHGQTIKKICQAVGTRMTLRNAEKHSQPFDFVFCLKGTQWPVEALEWKTRKRLFNWPKAKLFNKIIHAGYFLAAVGSKESEENEIQWRVSFNEAEQLLIQSFNETQVHCIILLKSLKNCLSDKARKNITSYTMKTVMFWCLEETSDEFWKPSNLMRCFCVCVSKLKEFVDEGILPNFFIKDRNQFVKSEFTPDIQNNTSQYLESLLVEPTNVITDILQSYRRDLTFQMHFISHKHLITGWLTEQVSITQLYRCVFCQGFYDLYDGNNIKNILKRCNTALDKLKRVSYAQPIIKNLQSFLGVLHYILLRGKKNKGKKGLNPNARKLYSDYMTLSASGDITHSVLRIATCYLDDGEKEDCLKKIRTVTDLDSDLFMETHSQRLIETLHRDIEALKETQLGDPEIEICKSIIYNTDLVHQDPYKTTDEFEQWRKNDHVLIGYDTLTLAWTRSYFDVTFMQAELPVLPKPAALELCIDKERKRISFHPFLYGLLLEYLWHEKYRSGNWEKETVLKKMLKCVSNIADEQKSIGFNFIAYCYTLQKRNRAAFMCLFMSLKFNQLKTNVAYRYMKYKLEKIRIKSAQLRRSARNRTNLPIVVAASARKKGNQRVPATTSVPASQLPTVDTVTPFISFIPVTSSAGTYVMLYSQTGAGISTSASTSSVDSPSTGVMSPQLRRSARKRKSLPIVVAASARKKGNQRVSATTSVPAPQLPTVDTVTPFISNIPVTSSAGTYLRFSSQTGAGISNSARTSPIVSTSTGVTFAQLRRSARKRKTLPKVDGASARKKATQRLPATMSVTTPHLTTVDTVTPFIPIRSVTRSTGKFLTLSSQTGAGISTSASTSPVDSMSTGDTLLYSRVLDQREYNTVTRQDILKHS